MIWRTHYNSTQTLYNQLHRPEKIPSVGIKPAWKKRGTGGLWFSRVMEDGKSQWQQWCEEQDFSVRENAFEKHLDVDSSKISNLLTISARNTATWLPFVDYQKGYQDGLFPTDIRWWEIGGHYDGVIVEYHQLYELDLHVRYLFSSWDVDTLCYWSDLENIYKGEVK